MSDAHDPRTSPTLLGKLRQCPTDQAAWEEFVRRYGRMLLAWCRHWGLQEHDAQDVVQNVLLTLHQKLQNFAYDPNGSFRGWLHAVAHHACQDLQRKNGRQVQADGQDKTHELLQNVAARDDLFARLDQEFDRELLEEASRHVQLRVEPKSWEAFHLQAVEGRSGAEVAVRLQMHITAVFQAKYRVQELLKKEVARLRGPENF